jgi:hypothetical protein
MKWQSSYSTPLQSVRLAPVTRLQLALAAFKYILAQVVRALLAAMGSLDVFPPLVIAGVVRQEVAHRFGDSSAQSWGLQSLGFDGWHICRLVVGDEERRRERRRGRLDLVVDDLLGAGEQAALGPLFAGAFFPADAADVAELGATATAGMGMGQ